MNEDAQIAGVIVNEADGSDVDILIVEDEAGDELARRSLQGCL